MIKIIPAILPSSYRAIDAGIAAVADVVDTVQIDFVDGYFATNRTWWFNGKDTERVTSILAEEEGLPAWQDINYEFDLMVRDPLEHMDTFIALGPSKLIFHIESMDESKMLAYFAQLPEIVKDTISFGIAIGIETDPSLIAPYIDYIDTIQCMGIAQVGFQGQPFDERVFDQIAKVKTLYPGKTISVDGAVDAENIGQLAARGVTTFVVGSAIFQNIDPRGTIDALCKQATASAN